MSIKFAVLVQLNLQLIVLMVGMIYFQMKDIED